MRSLTALLAVSASLHITVWPDGAPGPHHSWTLRCSPASGTLPHRVRACTRLARLRRPFARTPRNVACTQIYDGPQEARVQGSFRDHAVDALFDRRDGCATARWERIRFLLR